MIGSTKSSLMDFWVIRWEHKLNIFILLSSDACDVEGENEVTNVKKIPVKY